MRSPSRMSTAHEFLTDQGCYIHTRMETAGDLGVYDWTGGHFYDVYQGDSHDIILVRGLIVAMDPIDWDEYRSFCGPEGP